MRGCAVFQFCFRIILKYMNRNFFMIICMDKDSPLIPVDSIAQQVELRTGIPKVRIQIPLKSTFFSWLRQCQIIMKKVLFMYRWEWFWESDAVTRGNLAISSRQRLRAFRQSFFDPGMIQHGRFWEILSREGIISKDLLYTRVDGHVKELTCFVHDMLAFETTEMVQVFVGSQNNLVPRGSN